MKHVTYIFPALAVLALLSCGKATPEPEPTKEPASEEPTVISVTSVSLDKEELTIVVGDEAILVATVAPDNADDKTVTWITSNPKVATVKDGKVKAIAAGHASITAQVGKKSAFCEVKVVERSFQFTLSSTDPAIFNAAGGTSTALVIAPEDWSISTDASWLTVSQSSGHAGETAVKITSLENPGKVGRSAVITLSIKGEKQTLEILQRGNVFTKTKIASGKVTDGVRLFYSGTKFTRIYMILPRPKTNQYQVISSWAAPGCTQANCSDGINSYIWKDVRENAIPASGQLVMSESFDAEVYRITTDFTSIKDIPAYDPESAPCKNFLGKESNGLIDPPHSKIVSVANTLWTESNRDIITYARKCHEWTYSNITYGNMNTGLHTIEELMNTMTGDCGNYSSVFISLLRAKGIPARHVVMVHGSLDEFHVRAEFYLPAYGWIPADPTWGNDYFGVFDGKYIVVTQGINNYVRGQDGNNFCAEILQTFFCWYWYAIAGDFSFVHSCTGLN